MNPERPINFSEVLTTSSVEKPELPEKKEFEDIPNNDESFGLEVRSELQSKNEPSDKPPKLKLGSVQFIEEYQGQVIEEQLGTGAAWKKTEGFGSVKRWLADFEQKPAVILRAGKSDYRLWSLSQVNQARADYEEKVESRRSPGFGRVEYAKQIDGIEINDEVGTWKAWLRLGYTNVYHQIKLSGIEPIIKTESFGREISLYSKAQIEEILNLRDSRMEYSQRPEGLRHPETGQRVHSIAGWAREYGFPRKTITKILEDIEARPTFLSKINNGRELPLYEHQALLAALYNYQFSFIGGEQVEADPLTGQVVGSRTAWARLLSLSSADSITRRVDPEEFVRRSANRQKSKLYSAEVVKKGFKSDFNHQISARLDRLEEIAFNLYSSEVLDASQGFLELEGTPFRIVDPLERNYRKQLALAWVESSKHWKGRILVNICHRDQIIQLEEGKMARVAAADQTIQKLNSELGLVGKDGVGRLRDGTPVATFEAWSKRQQISERKLRVAVAEGVVRPYYLSTDQDDANSKRIAVFTQAHINAIQGLSERYSRYDNL